MFDDFELLPEIQVIVINFRSHDDLVCHAMYHNLSQNEFDRMEEFWLRFYS